MSFRTNKIMELAAMMIKQAKILKSAGLRAEARGLTRRALAMKEMGHSHARLQQQMIPVRITRR